MSIELVTLYNHLILCRPLLLLPSIFPSIRVFPNELALCIMWAKYWNLSLNFSISPSNEYSGWISFRIDWFDLFAVQGTLKSLLQHHSSKASSAYLQWNILGQISARTKTREVSYDYQSHSWHISRQNYNSKRHVHPYVYNSTIYNSQDMEAI